MYRSYCSDSLIVTVNMKYSMLKAGKKVLHSEKKKPKGHKITSQIILMMNMQKEQEYKLLGLLYKGDSTL